MYKISQLKESCVKLLATEVREIGLLSGVI